MSTFNQIIGRMWQDNTLYTAMLELTYRCNLDCKICYNDVNVHGEPLGTGQYLTLLEELQGMGVMNVTFTGGEPLAHPDFFQLGATARNLGFSVRIKTNGHALREQISRRIMEEIDPFNLDISLHGATAETHDRQTRIPGSFNRLMGNLEILRRLGMRFRLNTPVTIWNECELGQICEIADRFGVPNEFDGDITPMDNGDRSPLDIGPTREGLLRIAEIQHARKLRNLQSAQTVQSSTDSLSPNSAEIKHNADKTRSVEKSCGAGSSTILVDPFGTVYPCVQWRVAVGSLHESSITDIWSQSPKLQKVREQATRAGEMLGKISGADSLGFCAGRAQQESGTVVQLYPLVQLRRELGSIVNSRPPLNENIEITGEKS